MRLDGDDLSFVSMFRRWLVRRSCLVVMSCGEAEVVVVVTGRRPCCEMAGAVVPRLLCKPAWYRYVAGRSCRGARQRCVARRRAPRALPTQGERSCV